MEYQIGEFSQIVRLPVKTVRYYHDEGILLPSRIDPASGYRFYNGDSIQRAETVKVLREFQFSIAEIAAIVERCGSDEDLAKILEQKEEEIQMKLLQYKELQKRLRKLRSAVSVKQWPAEGDVEMCTVPSFQYACISYKGRYSDVGNYIGTLMKACAGKAQGQVFCLYGDLEYREGDADITVCIKVTKPVTTDKITTARHPGGECLALWHHGSYETLGRSYRKIFDTAAEKGAALVPPVMEIYHKGPGMFFRGNPDKYVTEIRIPVKAPE